MVTGGRSPIFSKSESHSVMSDSAAPWTAAGQIPLSMEFSRQECWSGWPFPSPEDSPNPGIEPRSPALWADSLLSEPPGKATVNRAWAKGAHSWRSGSTWRGQLSSLGLFMLLLIPHHHAALLTFLVSSQFYSLLLAVFKTHPCGWQEVRFLRLRPLPSAPPLPL